MFSWQKLYKGKLIVTNKQSILKSRVPAAYIMPKNTQSLFQSHENIKLTIIFQLLSMLRYRPFLSSTLIERRNGDQFSTIFQL